MATHFTEYLNTQKEEIGLKKISKRLYDIDRKYF